MIRACRIQKRSRLAKKTSEKEYEAVEDRRYEIMISSCTNDAGFNLSALQVVTSALSSVARS